MGVIAFLLENKALISQLVVALPLVTRALYALKNNGGISGMWKAIWYGTNTPKKEVKDNN